MEIIVSILIHLKFQIIASSELWKRFLHSIFYVGKGKSSRPYAHLYDAIKMYHGKYHNNKVLMDPVISYQLRFYRWKCAC